MKAIEHISISDEAKENFCRFKCKPNRINILKVDMSDVELRCRDCGADLDYPDPFIEGSMCEQCVLDEFMKYIRSGV